jgi:hypothetical protein
MPILAKYTSSICIGGSASDSHHYGTLDGARAFDHELSTNSYWDCDSATFPGEWIVYDLGAGVTKIPAQYTIKVYTDFYPTGWLFQGSNDGTNWTTIDTQTGQTFASNEKIAFKAFSNSTAYRYFRWYINAANHSNEVIIRELEVMEVLGTAITPSAGIWLSPDGTPLSSTLTAKACLIDADWAADCTGAVGNDTVGVDLGSSQDVGAIILGLCSVTGVFTDSWGGYYSTSYDSFHVYSSDDNSTWTLRESFNAPGMINDGTQYGHVCLKLATPFNARYIKLGTDGGGWAQVSNGENLRATEIEVYAPVPGAPAGTTANVPATSSPETFVAPSFTPLPPTIKSVPAISAAETFLAPAIHTFDTFFETVTDTLQATDSLSLFTYLELMDSIMFYEQDPGIEWRSGISEALTLTDVIQNIWGISADDWLCLIDSQSNSWDGREIIPDALNLYDLSIAAGMYNKEIDESLGIADATVYKLVVTCLEALGFNDLASMMKSVAESVSESMKIDDSLDGVYPQLITDTLVATDIASVIGLFLSTVMDALGISDTAATIKAMTAAVNDPIVFIDTVSTRASLFSAVYDGLKMECLVDLAGEVWECYVLNTPKFLPSMYSGFDFNSYCVSEGRVFGANDTGIFELTGSTDAGSKIHTGVILSATDFEAPNQKRFRRGYLGISGDTPVMIFETETGQREAYVIDEHGKTVASSDLKSKKWKLSIVEFDMLDHIKLIPVVLTK